MDDLLIIDIMPDRFPNTFGGLDLLSSSIVLLDENRCVRYMNSAAENLLAISGNAASGKCFDQLVAGSDTLREMLDNVLR